ncbi:LysE family translocator [Pseudomonas sp. GD03860]|mgnify:CR=1 FL=1|uniref:LysE family translocator n=1 Tax=Pseudomonas TaxID=286 RepID=UPI0023639046|nr:MULTISPECIES: LysE family translocator [Pseudomonas]MDD2056443.1 LysE family translocator [Pseudomonas putida]MDH0638858.1 LysE family translocator [Pseudomonas sp. GD03860]
MTQYSLFIAALLVVYLVPGPDMFLLLNTGASEGRRQALMTALGLALARAAHVTLAALGLAALLRTHPWAFDLLSIAGGLYLAWLGWQLLCAKVSTLPTSTAEARQPGHWSAALKKGLLTNLLNPKALLFCSVLLPQFISPHAGSISQQFAILGTVLVVVGLGFDSVYALSGDRLGRWVAASPWKQKLQNRLFGTLLIGFGARLVLLRELGG